MAGPLKGGTLLVEIIGDFDRDKLISDIKVAVKGVGASIPVELKVKKGDVDDLVKDLNADLKKRTVLPVLPVKLKVAKGEIKEAVLAANAHIKTLKEKPSLNVGMSVTALEARRAITQANARLKASKIAAPKLKVELDLDTRQAELVRDLQVRIKTIDAGLKFMPVEIPVELDPESIKELGAKALGAAAALEAQIKKKLDFSPETAAAAASAAAAKTQAVQTAQMRNGLDKRSLMEQAHSNKMALLHERAEIGRRSSSGLTLRVLRNDLSQFDVSSTRILRRALLGFTLLNVGIAAGFAATATAAIVQFGKIEQAANKAASLFTSQQLGGSRLVGEAFKTQLLSINRETTAAITNTSRQVAVETKFNTEEIAEGFRFLAGAGVDLAQSMASIPTVARLAQAGFMELEATSDLLIQGFIAGGGNIKQFGNEVEELSDKLVFVANESAVTLEEVLKAFSNRAGASFKAAGQNADEALNVIRLFGQTGIKGLKGGEQSAILIREIMRSATLKAPEGFKKLGIQIANADGTARSFALVLDDLTRVLNDRTGGFTKPGELVKVLNEELKLTEKSSGGLRQLIPSLAELQKRGSGAADSLRQLRQESAGRLAAQTQAVTDTLSFQFEAFGNNVSNLASEFATTAGRALTDFFKDVNGGAEGTTSLFKRLGGEAKSMGQGFGEFMRNLLDGLQGAEGKEFFGGIVEGVRSSLAGFRGLFSEFRTQVFGEGSDRGFFAIMGDAFEAFGNFSERNLPKIGYLLGTITAFVRDNTVAVKLMAVAWLGMLAFSKILRLLIIPIAGVTKQLALMRNGIIATASVGWLGTLAAWTAGLFGVSTEAMRATAATRALTTAQTQAAIAAAATGLGAGKAGKLAKGTAGPETAATAAAAASATKGTGAFARLSAAIATATARIRTIDVDFKKFARATLAIPIVLGIIKGSLDQLNESFGGDGKTSMKDFGDGLKVVGGAIGAVVGPILNAVAWFGKLLFIVGKFTGMILTWGIIGLLKMIAWAGKELWKAIKNVGEWVADTANKFPALRDAVLNAIPGVNQLASAFGALKDIQIKPDDKEWDFSRESEGMQNIGESLKFLGEGWAGHSEGVSKLFLDMSEGVTHNNKKIDENIAKNEKLRQTRWKATQEAAAAAELLASKHRVLGLGENYSSAAAAASAAGNKRLAAILLKAGDNATIFQKRVAFLALTHAVLANKTKFAAQYQIILAGSSRVASKNLEVLSGGKKKLAALFDALATGSEEAARSLNRNGVEAIKLAHALERLHITENAPGSLRGRMLADDKADEAADIKRYRTRISSMLDAGNKAMGEGLDLSGLNAGMTDVADTAAEATKTVQTAAEKATAAVDKLTVAQFKVAAQGLINKVSKLPGIYKATAFEGALLAKAMPAIDKAIERQTGLVSKLDAALQALQSTQLLGTKAAADAAFGSDQEVKALQLQKIDLQIGGAKDEDPAIKALDEQIAAIQLRAERAALAASIGLDPLKKKLEETFTPVKELSFEAIMAQFTKLSAAREQAQGSLTKTEALKKKLDEVVAAQADKFASIGLNVSGGIVAGMKSGTAAVTKAAKDTAANLVRTTKQELGVASPSTVMAEIGLHSSMGFEQGIRSGAGGTRLAAAEVRIGAVNALLTGVPHFRAAGVQALSGFKEGMQKVWKESGPWGNSIQEFVLGIAAWIQRHKGPIAYDAQLLRPAGEAIMSGFHRGLNDGFGEVKGWVKGVAGQIGDNFPNELMFKRSARFLLNNVKADATFTAEDAFNDLLPEMFTGIGGMDPALGFLHKTLSLADTTDMARKLIGLYPSMNIGGIDRATGTRTAAGYISDHTYGTAADLGTGGRMPTVESLELFKKLKPLLGTVFKQLIHNGMGMSAGGGSFGDRAHFDHIHAAWLMGPGFDKHSGKKGSSLNIPGLPPLVAQALLAASAKTGVPAALLAAISKQESGWRAQIGSPAGAQGLMQLMPGTAAGLGVSNINDPFQNALGGAKYIKQQLAAFGSLKLALAAYNAGPGAVQKYGGIPPYAETQHYVQAVMEYLRKFGGVGNFRRHGGNVNANMATWVGESGRELWVPDRSGTVISNQNIESLIRMAQSGQLHKSGGDITYAPTNHIHSNSPDSAAVAAQVDARMRAQIVKVVR